MHKHLRLNLLINGKTGNEGEGCIFNQLMSLTAKKQQTQVPRLLLHACTEAAPPFGHTGDMLKLPRAAQIVVSNGMRPTDALPPPPSPSPRAASAASNESGQLGLQEWTRTCQEVARSHLRGINLCTRLHRQPTKHQPG